ncbi:TPA: hypothetical protein KHV10_004672 [Escherichia coli]|nr:hypothetical protein [Escherichia coli]
MKHLPVIFTIVGTIMLSGCGNSTPPLVSNINKMQIPVVPHQERAISSDNVRLHSVYASNLLEMSQMTSLLKQDFLTGTRTRDMFDSHSEAHQVYLALTNIEQAQMVNEQYYQEGNLLGLQKIQTMLETYDTENELVKLEL